MKLLSLFVVVFLATSVLAESGLRRAGQSVRFYCAEFPHLTKYVKDGTEIAPYVFGEVPPRGFSLMDKDGHAQYYSWTPGRVSDAITIPLEESGQNALVLYTNAPDSPTGQVPAKAKPTRQGRKDASYLPFAEFSISRGASSSSASKPQVFLAVVYQPNLAGLWLMPKTLMVDLSESQVPKGACLMVNLTNYPVQSLIGLRGAPQVLQPGAASVVVDFDRDTDEYSRLRVAMATPKGVVRLLDGERKFSKAFQQLVVISPTEPTIGGGLPAMVKVIPIQ